MVITINKVLKVYASLLTGNLSYPDADRWAWGMIQHSDNNNLQFEPLEDKPQIWELIQFLYGIDMPDVKVKEKTARDNLDIIDFLEEKLLYNRTKTFM